MTSSGSLSLVIRLTVSPQIPLGNKRLFTQTAYVHPATLQFSSASLHQTESRRYNAAFLIHLKEGQVAEQGFASTNRYTSIEFVKISTFPEHSS
jgi:hypothetical protein